MLAQCWPSVENAGPTLNQHWVNVSCLLGKRNRISGSRHTLEDTGY